MRQLSVMHAVQILCRVKNVSSSSVWNTIGRLLRHHTFDTHAESESQVSLNRNLLVGAVEAAAIQGTTAGTSACI